jgi:dihydrofolate synthase/folylpolyglutamate synthase
MDMIRWLYGLQHFGVKLGLDNIRSLLDVLGHPERRFPCLLVGGTNGKGSVAAMLESMLRAHGVPTGMFTSPHLVRPNERIRIDGEDITDEELDRNLQNVRSRIEQAINDDVLPVHPSFFEVITATSLLSFKERNVAAAVLEVGLGGRLDATNAVDADLSVVVSVDMDHTKTLGDSLTKIAREKGGIVKPGKPLVSGVVQQRAIDVLREIARLRGAQYCDARAQIALDEDADGAVSLSGASAKYDRLRIPLAGRHQLDNARIAVAALECFAPSVGIEPNPEAVRLGLEGVRWSGRLQWIESDGMPPMLLDAAHNPAGVQALIAYLRCIDRPKPVAVFGATSGKPLERMLRPMSAWVESIIVTRPPVNRGLGPDAVAEEARLWFHQVDVVPDPAEALALAAERAGRARYVLVTGSLHLVGEILGELEGARVPGPIAL